MAEVLLRHQLDAESFYRWEREAKAAMLAALGSPVRRRGDGPAREIERAAKLAAGRARRHALNDTRLQEAA